MDSNGHKAVSVATGCKTGMVCKSVLPHWSVMDNSTKVSDANCPEPSTKKKIESNWAVHAPGTCVALPQASPSQLYVKGPYPEMSSYPIV